MLQVSGNVLQQVEKFNRCGIIHEWPQADPRDWSALVWQTQYYVIFIVLWSQNKLSFYISLCSDSHLRSWILGNDLNSPISNFILSCRT